MDKPARRGVTWCLALIPALVALTACATAPKRTGMLKDAPNVRPTTAQLRVQVRALAGPLCGIIEETADEVLYGTTDPVIRDVVLRFKTNGIPELQRALFQPDPLAALIDAWALTFQLEELMESDRAHALLQDWQPVVFQAFRRLDDGIEALAHTIAPEGDIETTRSKIRDWARQHPVEFSLASRQSTVGLLAELTARTNLGALRAVGTMVESVDDLSARVDIYNEYLPKLARWHAEMAMNELLTEPWMVEVLGNFQDSRDSLVTLAGNVDGLPQLLQQERAVLLEALQAERELVLAFVESELRRTLRYVTSERVAVMGSVSGERDEAIQALQRERIAAIEAVDEMREASLHDIEEIAARLLDGGLRRSTDVVDHFFKRAALFTAVLLAVLGAGAVLLLRYAAGPRG